MISFELPEGVKEGFFKLKIEDSKIILTPVDIPPLRIINKDLIMKLRVGEWPIYNLNVMKANDKLVKEIEVAGGELWVAFGEDSEIAEFVDVFSVSDAFYEKEELTDLIEEILVNFQSEPALGFYLYGIDGNTSHGSDEAIIAVKQLEYVWEMRTLTDWLKETETREP
jgi:hypothetical protein